jgi:hypothetical protein
MFEYEVLRQLFSILNVNINPKKIGQMGMGGDG